MRQRETPAGLSSLAGLSGNVWADKGQATSIKRSIASSPGGEAVRPGLTTLHKVTDLVAPVEPPRAPRQVIPPLPPCTEHGRYGACPEHDCPHCFVAD
jgi:hypothetical protein